MTAELLADRDLALQLHRMLSDIDPVRWQSTLPEMLRPQLSALQQTLEQRPEHRALASTLKQELPANDNSRSSWLAFKQRVLPAYTELAKRLQAESIHVPSLRPTNHARSLFHFSSAAVAVVALQLMPSSTWVLSFAAAWCIFAWSCEILRRIDPRINALMMKAFHNLAHAHEAHRINSATWYASSLLLLALTRSLPLGMVAVAVLGVGDPIAALVGRRFGRTRLLHGRSLEGTLAFIVSSALVSFGLLRFFHESIGVGGSIAIALAASIAGAIAELVSLRVDDNLSIPLSAAAGVAVVAVIGGIPL